MLLTKLWFKLDVLWETDCSSGYEDLSNRRKPSHLSASFQTTSFCLGSGWFCLWKCSAVRVEPWPAVQLIRNTCCVWGWWIKALFKLSTHSVSGTVRTASAGQKITSSLRKTWIYNMKDPWIQKSCAHGMLLSLWGITYLNDVSLRNNIQRSKKHKLSSVSFQPYECIIYMNETL